MPVYTVTKIVYKANGDKEFYNVDALQTTCQTISAESVSGTTHTLTTNTGEIIYDILTLQCVLVEPSGVNPGGIQCFAGGMPVSNDYWLNTNQANIGDGPSETAWGSITGTLSDQSDLSNVLSALISGKEPTINAGSTGQYYRGDKSWQTLDKSAVGLGNVDNTSDANKPVSSATQTALNGKQATLVSGTNIKTINGASVLGSGDLPVSGSNMATADLTATADRTHNFAQNFLRFTNLEELRADIDTSAFPSGQHFLRGYVAGTTHAWFMRSGDATDNATIQLITDTDHVASQLELSAKGNTVIDIDSDTHVRFGTTLNVGSSARIRIMGNTNTHYVELRVPDLIENDVAYTLPETIVENGIMTVSQTGVLSFLTAAQLQALSTSWIKLAADYTLNSVNTEQKLFNTTPNGALTLPTGTYMFDTIIYVTTTSSTSGNFAFDPIGGGTAVGASFLYHTVGVDNNTPTNAATQTGSFSATQQTVASAVTGGTGTAAGMKISGTFRITTGGTIIPSITLVTANAAVVKAGTYFSVTRIAEHNVNSVGAWT